MRAPDANRSSITKWALALPIVALVLLSVFTTNVSAEPNTAGPKPTARIPPIPLPCGRTRFVTVYDSHGLTMFGEQLDHFVLAQKDAELDSYTLGGASPEWLVTTKVSIRGYHYSNCEKAPLVPRSKLNQRKLRAPTIHELFAAPTGTYERQVVLLTLGSNIPGNPTAQIPNIEKTVRQIRSHPGALCFWIGPPSMRRWNPAFAERTYQAIRDGIAAADDHQGKAGPPCYLIDSRKLSSYPDGGDGWHYGFFPAGIEGAIKWADGVAGEVKKILHDLGPPKPLSIQNLFDFERGSRTPPFWAPLP